MMNGAISELNRIHPNIPIEIEAYKETKEVARDNASGIMYYTFESCLAHSFYILIISFFFVYRIGYETTTNCTLGASGLGSRNERAFDTGKKTATKLVTLSNAKSCVDTNVQDQVIIFMALAKGVSRIRCTLPLTMHTKTAIYIAEQMTDAKFNVIEEGGGIIECIGIGFDNPNL